MTYIITSNSTDTSPEDPITDGINNPVSFTNMLSSTFQVEPNSEIAVESIKFTRNGNLQLDSHNNQFAVFIGRDINACGLTLAECPGFPSRTFIRGGNATTSPLDMCERIKYGLYAGCGQHPNFVPVLNSTADSNFKVELKGGAGAFTGFKYSFAQNLSRNASGTNVAHIPAIQGQGGYVSTDIVNLNASISASGSKGVVIHKADALPDTIHCSVIGQAFPLNMANGSVVYTYNSSANGSAGHFWEVGLTRPTINEGQANAFYGDGVFGRPEHAKNRSANCPSDIDFFDFSVKEVYNATTEDFELDLRDFSFFGDAGAENDLEGDHKMRSVSYNGGTKFKSASFVSVRFTAVGDTINVHAIKSDGSASAMMLNDSATKNLRYKPIGINTFYLFPKITMKDEASASRIMVVDDYDGLDIPTFRYGKTNLSYQYGGREDTGNPAQRIDPAIPGMPEDLPALCGNSLTGELTHQDFYSDVSRTGGEGLSELMDAREVFDMNSTYKNVKQGLNASGGVNAGITIITTSDGLYNGRDTDVAGGYTRECGAQNIMGFETTPVQTVNTYTSSTQGNLGVLESKTTPKMISNKSLFVRLPDFPIESYNTGKGSISKILTHIPRFDNSGNEVGGLFFKSDEKLYVPLNNVNTLRLNSMKVEICNIDETTDNVDLVGQTIVCFDMRKRRN